MKIIANMTKAEADASIETLKNIARPFCKKDINAEIGKGIRKSGTKFCNIVETIDDAGNVQTEMSIDEEYLAASLKVAEVFCNDFAPEIMGTITKIVMMVKGVQESKFSCKIKHFQEKAKKIMAPFNKDDSKYAVIEVNDLDPIGIYAAAVVEDNGFCRKLVYTTCNSDRAAMKFVDSIVGKIDLDAICAEEFVLTCKGWAIDAAAEYVSMKRREAERKTAITDVKQTKDTEDEDKYVFNGVRGGMDISEDVDRIDAEFIVE